MYSIIMYNISPKMPSGQEHGVLRNCGLISSSPFVARRLFQLPSSAGFRQNSPWNLGCFSAVSRCCGFNPQVRGFLNRRLRLQEIPMSFSLKCWFQTYFFVETKVPHNFLLKCPFSPLKPPPYQWTPRFCRWNPWPRCLLRKASRRLQEALQPSGGRPSTHLKPS